jgi:transcription-repair coupling factor (superfamily II helicase)
VLDHADPAAHAWLIAVVAEHAARENKRRLWIVSDTPRHRERLATELELWGISALILPDSPSESAEGTITDPESAAEWFSVLETLARADSCAVICGSDSFHSVAPSPTALRDSRTILKPGQELDPSGFSEALTHHGYERSATVAGRGQFAVRGGILDFFPWQAPDPIRIEFFDTTIESIREFDLDSQSSTRKLTSAEFLLEEPAASSLVGDYKRPGDIIIAVEDIEIECHVRITGGAAEEPADELEDGPCLLDLDGEDFSTACYGSPLGAFDAGDFVLEQSRRDSFFSQLNEWQRGQWDVAMAFSNDGERERFTELAGHDLERDLHIIPLAGQLFAGFTVPALRLAVLSSSELFGRYRTPGTTRRSKSDHIRAARARTSLDEISLADLVVHHEYGIGRFRGIQDTGDGEEILIEYHGGSLLSVPLDQAHLVAKYIGLGGKTPDLNNLGGTAWKNARRAAEKSILDYAAQILRVQADRQATPGYAHPPDSRWMWEFENSFHFTETPDQKRSIEEAKRDMESSRPMDRLVCGDVGFGKTEVAIRAAFKTVTGGKQVAILVPTTVLAEQHWRTFRERMSDYPIRIELLSRFRTPSQIRDTVRGVADGSVDVVIGTHRLLSADISFPNLGLAVIDEEQRFGVKHKDRFKDLFRHIDVLTLSATPIPRTLYMALMGARDMSTIDTPPPNRIPVQTTVAPYEERIIRDAIRREMHRGGQVFFLHNRVKSIEMVRDRLRELVPEARVLIGHGQMPQDELETVMKRFVAGEADVLLSTTIIETGIDIPNANTIIIDRADRFGLADLYQLRGRVGRAGEKAYAILLLPRDMMTTGDARKRVNAIKQYTALGSGFKIAMRDLEIRGAGNLLGTKQSGHIAAVGFDLYCQLLRQSIDRIKGREHQTSATPATLKSDFIEFSEPAYRSIPSNSPRPPTLPLSDSSSFRNTEAPKHRSTETPPIPAFIPSSWLPDTSHRISAYRDIAEARTLADLKRIESSWRDRFGRIPEATTHLLSATRLRILAGTAGIASVEIKGQRLMLHRNGDYILLDGHRFPRLQSLRPADKLAEAIYMVESL